jgi:hypothetical protein
MDRRKVPESWYNRAVNWNKLKSLFVVANASGGSMAASNDTPLPSDMSDIDPELAKYLVPEAAAEPAPALPASTDPTQLTGTIDFQGLYDQAGIPNTDEVESLEKFLNGLDTQLPQASKQAAAKAFLGAIGKAHTDVLTDAERKIQVVRAVDASKQADVNATLENHQRIIDDLQRQIEEQRAAMETARRDLESVRGQCAVEEARLQGARLFFGHMDAIKTPA